MIKYTNSIKLNDVVLDNAPIAVDDSATVALGKLQAQVNTLLVTPEDIVQTSTFSALANYSYSLDSSAGAFEVELPTSADDGAIILFNDVGNAASINHIIFKQSTTTITILATSQGCVYLFWNTILGQWQIITQSTPFQFLSNYEALYVNPTYGDDVSGTGLIDNQFKTVQACIDSFAPATPHVIYVGGSTTEDITFRTNDQSLRIVFDPQTSHTGTITLVATNTSIYFDSLDGSATISGDINDDSSGLIYYNVAMSGTYSKTGGSGAATPAGFVELSANSNISGLSVFLTGNSTMRTVGTGAMGVLTALNGTFIANHIGTMQCPFISDGANPSTGVPIVLLQGKIQLLIDGSGNSLLCSAVNGSVYLNGISTLQDDLVTLGKINFTGAGDDCVCYVWSNCQLATSGDIFPSTGALLPNAANYLSANYTPTAYTPVNTSVNGHLQGINAALLPVATTGVANYSTTATYSIGSIIRGDGTNGLIGQLLTCNTAATTGAFNLSKWDNFSTSANSTHLYNTTLGVTAGNNTMTATQVVAVGYGALAVNTNGGGNTAVGYQALTANTGGSGNVALGTQSLVNNTNGANNLASGYQALASNTNGPNNTASGCQALFSNTTGAGNTAAGNGALYSMTTGAGNTASGAGALASSVKGDFNAAFGYSAGSRLRYVATLGAITGGSLYTNGTYNNVLMSLVTAPTMTVYPRANITVSGGVVTSCVLVNGGVGGNVGTVLTVTAAQIGGTGSGFSVPVATFNSPSNSTYVGGYQCTNVSDAATSNNVILSDGAGNIVFRANGVAQAYNANTAWTPTDASGASLAFIVTSATYSTASNQVTFTTTLTYPTTSNASNAIISGLPRPVNQQTALPIFAIGLGVTPVGVISTGGTSIALYNALTGVAIPNSTLSGKTLTISGTYST